MAGQRRGLVDHGLHPLRDVHHDHCHEIQALDGERAKWDRLVELNVIRQVTNVASDIFVQDAWARGQELNVHGWVYSIANGLINDLGVDVASPADLGKIER